MPRLRLTKTSGCDWICPIVGLVVVLGNMRLDVEGDGCAKKGNSKYLANGWEELIIILVSSSQLLYLSERTDQDVNPVPGLS